MNNQLLNEAAKVVNARLPDAHPACGLILGSGLSGAADIFNTRLSFDYHDIPGLGDATVDGHPGRLLWADFEGMEALVFLGRRHWYEGAGWDPVALPVYLLKTLGARVLLVTNAAGGIRKDLAPGDIMIIDDHINAMGVSPLAGPHDPFWGSRFPDQSAVYDPELRRLTDAAAKEAGGELAHGVYAAVSGPATETPAEIRALRSLGADAVGMSTVPEAMLASSAGLRVFGASCIVNVGAGLSSCSFSHENVTRAAGEAVPEMRRLLRAFFSRSARKSIESCLEGGA